MSARSCSVAAVQSGDERRAAARLRAAAEKALRAEGSYLVVPELLLVAADLLTARAPIAAAQLVATAGTNSDTTAGRRGIVVYSSCTRQPV
jgi:hypothetical protein